MPCCAGEAPLIAEAQLGLLSVGRTARASRVQAERAINSRRRGTRAVATPSTLSPSTPMTMTRGPCQEPAGSAKIVGQQPSARTSGSNFVLGPIVYSYKSIAAISLRCDESFVELWGGRRVRGCTNYRQQPTAIVKSVTRIAHPLWYLAPKWQEPEYGSFADLRT